MSDAWERPVSGWPVGAWAMAGMLPIVGGIGISANVLSPGLALDLISLWPGLLPVVVALVIVAIKKAWRRTDGGFAAAPDHHVDGPGRVCPRRGPGTAAVILGRS